MIPYFVLVAALSLILPSGAVASAAAISWFMLLLGR